MMFGDQTPIDEARKMIESCREAGLYAVDTADNYAGGASERMVGQLIAADRERWIVATKVANAIGDQPNDRGLSRRWVMREVDNSLRRLDTDWIDVYYMHRDDESTPIEEVLSTFARLIEMGKIRYYGLSLTALRLVSLKPSCCPVATTTAWAWWPTARSRAACSQASTSRVRRLQPTAVRPVVTSAFCKPSSAPNHWPCRKLSRRTPARAA